MIQQDPSEASAADYGRVPSDDPAGEGRVPDYTGPINPVQYLKDRKRHV